MRHPLTEQFAVMRLQARRGADIVFFALFVAAGVVVIIEAALHAPTGWMPLP